VFRFGELVDDTGESEVRRLVLSGKTQPAAPAELSRLPAPAAGPGRP
jgi:hypothetical protein